MLHDIHTAVVGDDKLGHEGLVNGFRRHDKWIRRADIRIAGISGGAFVLIFIAKWLFWK